MEVLLGMMLLLQIVISIQIMLVGKQVLQRIAVLESKLPDTPKTEKEKIQQDGPLFEQEEIVPKQQEWPVEKPEVLLNEVLAEVFS